jgi:hypothetical protein
VGEVAGGLSCQARAHVGRQGGILLESMPLFGGGRSLHGAVVVDQWRDKACLSRWLFLGERSLHGVVPDMGVEIMVEQWRDKVGERAPSRSSCMTPHERD